LQEIVDEILLPGPKPGVKCRRCGELLPVLLHQGRPVVVQTGCVNVLHPLGAFDVACPRCKKTRRISIGPFGRR